MRRSSLPLACLAWFLAAGAAEAATITIDFESLSNGDSAIAYLAGFGVTATTEPGTSLFAFDDTLTYGGGVVDAPSGTMYLHQTGSVPGLFPPNTFTLTFATPLDAFGFSDSAILVPSINSPWTATAFDGPNGTGSVLGSIGYSPPSVHPTIAFSLAGPGIRSVVFNQTAAPFAAFFGANLDDFVLTTPDIEVVPEPASVLCWSLLFGAGVAAVRRQRRRPVI